MSTGYIKKHRKIEQNSALWNNERAYNCFDKLLLFSNRNNGVYISGLRPLSKRLGNWSLNTTKKALKELVDLGCIKLERAEEGTKITIIKYLDYQKKGVSKIDTPKQAPTVSKFDTPLGQKLIQQTGASVSKIDTGVGQELIQSGSKIDTPIYKDKQETTEKLYIQDAIPEKKELKVKGEKKRKPITLDFIEDLQWRSLMQKWIDFKKNELKDPYKTLSGVKTCFRNLQEYSNNNLETAKKIVDRSIDREWLGLFALNDTYSSFKKKTTALASPPNKYD